MNTKASLGASSWGSGVQLHLIGAGAERGLKRPFHSPPQTRSLTRHTGCRFILTPRVCPRKNPPVQIKAPTVPESTGHVERDAEDTVTKRARYKSLFNKSNGISASLLATIYWKYFYTYKSMPVKRSTRQNIYFPYASNKKKW